MATWQLPTATALPPGGWKVSVPLRLHVEASSTASLWWATSNIEDVLLAAWTHEQNCGGRMDVCRLVAGVVLRCVQHPTAPFQPVGDVRAFAADPTCAGLYLPVDTVLRPTMRPATWQQVRVPKAVHLFDGRSWLVLPQQGFCKLSESIEVVSAIVHRAGEPWIVSGRTEPEIELIGAKLPTAVSVVRTVSAKPKPSIAKRIQQFFAPTTTTKKTKNSDVDAPIRLARASATLGKEIVQQLMKRDSLTREQEAALWRMVADDDAHQATVARGNIEWLNTERTPVDPTSSAKGVRAVWLHALAESGQRGGDCLHLATVYDQLQQYLDHGLDRIHDLPEFLWPGAGDPMRGLLELHAVFNEHGPSGGVAAAFVGLLFATAALRCHEARLAVGWLEDTSEVLKALPQSATTRTISALTARVRDDLRHQVSGRSCRLGRLECPKIVSLVRKCCAFKPLVVRVPEDDPEWQFLGRVPRGAVRQRATLGRDSRLPHPRRCEALGSPGSGCNGTSGGVLAGTLAAGIRTVRCAGAVVRTATGMDNGRSASSWLGCEKSVGFAFLTGQGTRRPDSSGPGPARVSCATVHPGR
jgi:hypothetical protein